MNVCGRSFIVGVSFVGGDRLIVGCLCSHSSLAEAPGCSDKGLRGSEIGF